MTKILHIDSSILGDASASRRLSAAAVAELTALHNDAVIIYRDLATRPLPHLTGEMVIARGLDPLEQRAELRDSMQDDAAALEEFLAADTVVIGTPMYNFGIPTQLKAWIDRLAVAGKTFVYTEQGPQGLAGGKTVVVASSRGGYYSAEPMSAFDHQEKYLAAVFGFMGITDIRFLRAEGVNVSAENRRQAIETAERIVAELVAA